MSTLRVLLDREHQALCRSRHQQWRNPSTVSFGMRAMLTYRSDHGRRCPTSRARRSCGNRSSPERKQQAAEAFWRDENAAIEQAEAIAAIAIRIKFRVKSVLAMPVEKKARHLVALAGVSEMVAARLLVAYHLAHQRPMMAAFSMRSASRTRTVSSPTKTLAAAAGREAGRGGSDPRRVVSSRRRGALSVHAGLAGPRDLGCPRRGARNPGAGSLVARVNARLAARCVWMDGQCRGVDCPRHADDPRNRPRHRQHRLHLDPGRQAAGRGARAGAQDRSRRWRCSSASRCCSSITWVMRLTTPLVRRVRPRDLRPRPDPARRRSVPHRQEHARDSREARRRGRRTAAPRWRPRSSASSSRSCCSTSCSRSTR